MTVAVCGELVQLDHLPPTPQPTPPTAWCAPTGWRDAHVVPALQLEPSLVSLLTNSRILPKVIGLHGTNTSVYHFHCNVTPAGTHTCGPGSTTDAASMSAYSAEDVDYDSLPCFGFHQDSGLQADTEYRPAPRFSLKAGAPSSHSKRVATLRYPDQLGLFRLLFHGRRQTRHGQHVDCPRPGKRLHYKPLSSPTKWLTWCTIGLCPRAADDG